MSWILLWKIMFIAVMVVFAVMAVLVTIFGAGDIRKLIAGLRDDADREDVDESSDE